MISVMYKRYEFIVNNFNNQVLFTAFTNYLYTYTNKLKTFWIKRTDYSIRIYDRRFECKKKNIFNNANGVL